MALAYPPPPGRLSLAESTKAAVRTPGGTPTELVALSRGEAGGALRRRFGASCHRGVLQEEARLIKLIS